MKMLFVVSILISTCTTMPKNQEIIFTQFPNGFRAIQVLTLTHGENRNTVIANLQKEPNGSYKAFFLHPLSQTPLLTLIYADGESKIIKHYDKLPPEVHGEEILKSIRYLYDSRDFRQTGELWHLKNDSFIYTLSDMKDFAISNIPYIFPQSIGMETINEKSAFKMSVETKELECD